MNEYDRKRQRNVEELPIDPPDDPREYWNEEWLRAAYCDHKLNQYEIAALCTAAREDNGRVTRSAVGRMMKTHEIPVRTTAEQNALHEEKKRDVPRPSNEELRAAYEDEKLSLGAIGKRFDVSGKTISRWLDEAKVPRRSLSEASQIAARTLAEGRDAADS